MILPDVNVLVHAFREDSPRHRELRPWLEGIVLSESSFGLSELVLSGFLRVVTHPRVFDPPTPLDNALAFVETLRDLPNCVLLAPGARHWSIFRRLCHESDAKGNRIPDAYLAALAIESGSEWVTTDRGFGRFKGLRCSAPH
jgi:toxin-antitoxin system PIN domain toxin